MILYPAIDLKGGRCVRLFKGDMSKATVFNDSPADQARAFERDGFEWLHVVDLDGAIEGRAVNAEPVSAILGAVSIPVQLGGGVRSLEGVERWLSAGVRRVILGTAAVRDPDLVRQAARAFPDRVAVGIDVRDGRVSVAGWVENSDIDPVSLARRFENAGVAALIVTDISRDGALTGVNVDQVGEVADAVSIPVIASGGVASTEDIARLKARPGTPVAGAIIGKALYTGAVRPSEALKVAA